MEWCIDSTIFWFDHLIFILRQCYHLFLDFFVISACFSTHRLRKICVLTIILSRLLSYFHLSCHTKHFQWLIWSPSACLSTIRRVLWGLISIEEHWAILSPTFHLLCCSNWFDRSRWKVQLRIRYHCCQHNIRSSKTLHHCKEAALSFRHRKDP